MTVRAILRRNSRSRWAAIATIAATYFYFLIFAEFAFLELAKAIAPGTGQVRAVMFALGSGGIFGALGAALVFRPSRGRAMLEWTMRACAASGLLSLAAGSLPMIALAAVLAGASLGALTVTLAASLVGAIGESRLGWGIGVGTGVAYALSNVPEIFHAAPAWQTLFAAMAVLGASLLPRHFLVAERGQEAGAQGKPELARWILILLSLVWLDSAAFYIIQHAPELRAATWSSPGTLWSNAAVHLVAGLAAGKLLDGRRRGLVAAGALVALGGAALVLNGSIPASWPANLFYTCGVSLYSVILVEFPARTARATTAAWVFGVAGWIGSALGIGMAQDLAQIPTLFIVAAAAAVVVALGFRFVTRAVIAGVAALGVLRADEIKLGREVYIAEGCIHCHSQYLRPRVATEILNWGPAAPLETVLAATPPLFGTRRQGPDLSNVGNRRSPEWNRLHLIEPRAITPGSRMPSYAHLFDASGGRGDALLAYLASLGAGTFEYRRAQIADWQPDPRKAIAARPAGKLFLQLCAQCHGDAGRGNGTLAARLSLRPPDWTTMPWRHVADDANAETSLCRIIKFGVPGTPMAGHEYLPDPEIVGLARHVRTLHKAGSSTPAAAVPP